MVAFYLPGYWLAVALRSGAKWSSGLILASLILFHGVFWLGVLRIPIRFGIVLVYEMAWMVGAGWLAWRGRKYLTLPANAGAKWDWSQKVLVGAGVVVLGILLLRSALVPLTGPDTSWRWDFLPQQILRLENFRFYPARSAEDFRQIFYADSIAPMVSFSYWWLYAAWGRHLPGLTSVLVTAQLAAVMALAYGVAKTLASPRAGALAVAVLASSLLMYFAVVIGQETGLTALALVGVLYFIVSAEKGDWRAMVLAGSAAALGTLSREYGAAIAGIGLITVIWRRKRPAEIVIYVATAAALALPWYVRTWALTGNPFYSTLSAGIFPENPVFGGVNRAYVEQLGIRNFDMARWGVVGQWLVRSSSLQVFGGMAALLLLARRHGYLLFATLIVVALWIMSFGLTANPVLATRVLSPAVVLCSVALAMLVDQWVKWRGAWIGLTVAVLALVCATAASDLVYPVRLSDAPASRWMEFALSTEQRQQEPTELKEAAAKMLPPRTRILSINAAAHPVMLGTDHEIVPIWSPEVSFVFDPGRSEEEIRARLIRLGIGAVYFNHGDLNELYLKRQEFYARGLKIWKPVAVYAGNNVLYRLPEVQAK